ncbi:hypothetical protein ACFL1Z_04600 [Thermodesulfobacteriota bacterium]
MNDTNSLYSEQDNQNNLKEVVEDIGYWLSGSKTDDWERCNSRFGLLASLRPYFIGAAAALSVVGFYLGLLTLTSDWYNARLEFREFGIWILALATGLGTQATLFFLFKAWRKDGKKMKAATCSLAASGGMSTTAMAACCAHYLTFILPVLGLPFLSAAAAGLAQYQVHFFFAGVISNMFGIGFMLRMMHRSGMIKLMFPLRTLTISKT